MPSKDIRNFIVLLNSFVSPLHI
uniref:Uncharacterized protein n=1 Tax=Anguilla anguilla TaxID=7936 RepID=A0A0E9RG33_ANGAN